MKIKGAIFDCDGTLMDSMGAWDHVGDRFLATIGITARPDLHPKVAVSSLYQAACIIKEDYDVDLTIAQIEQGMNDLVEYAYFNDVLPKPGVPEFLEGMKQRGIPMMIATATDYYLVEAALKRVGLFDYFQDIVTCNTVKQGKNKPDIYEYCLEKLGTKKEETPVFEDALYAMETAKAADFPLVAIKDLKTHEFLDRALEISDLYIEDWRNWSFDIIED